MLINLRVKPRSKNKKMSWHKSTNTLEIWTNTPPEKGKVNKEILKTLKKLFRADVQIIKGKYKPQQNT